MSADRSLVDPVALSAYHESVEPFAYADDGALVVRLRLAAGETKTVDVIHFDKFREQDTRVVVHADLFAIAAPHHDWFQARLTRESKRFKYWFRIQGQSGTRFLSRAGVTEQEPTSGAAFEVPYLGERDGFDPPEWTRGAVYYQVFPDRFARATEEGEDSPLPATYAKWTSVPTPFSVFGGSLQGIIEHLGHLVDLGVDVLYMTPIFKAPSNHKYDTVDYFALDPQFGDLETLRRLVNACHERGIRVVLDAVFNHMGASHPIFLDLQARGEESAYRDWIYANSWPLSLTERNYETFGYVANMPKWRTAHPDVEEYLCQVGEYWIREADIDGWRLDVSDEVEHRFWQHFRTRIKALKPDALICGEIWQVATPWLRGDEFDAVMNYPLRDAILRWLAGRSGNAHDFYDEIERIRSLYPEPTLHTLWNLLDSHDTPRLLTECKGSRTRMRLASFLQWTLPGAPLLYYGDEVGMSGGGDPLCRAGMIWDRELQDADLFAHYRQLNEIRKRYPALRTGELRPLWRGQNRFLYGFLRQTQDQTLLAAVNSGPSPVKLRLRDQEPGGEGHWTVVFGPGKGTVVPRASRLLLPGRETMLLLWVGDA